MVPIAIRQSIGYSLIVNSVFNMATGLENLFERYTVLLKGINAYIKFLMLNKPKTK